jgi:peptidoglycan/LPS O-acetylase OafA/YrhL
LVVVAACLLSCLALNYFRGSEAVLVRCIFYFYLGGLSCRFYSLARGKLGPRLEYLVLVPAAILFAFAVWQFRRSTDINWVLLLAVPCALVILATASPWFPGSLSDTAGDLGNLTYASYLLHFPLQVLIMLLVGALDVPHGFAFSPYFLCGYLAVLFGLSHFVYLKFELPMQQWIRDRTLGGPAAGA